MENQRIRLSKQMLKDALLRLLAEQEPDKISVYALCQEAQINRTTFYRYYGSIADVMNEIKNTFIEQLEVRILDDGSDPLASLAETLSFFWRNRERINILLRVYPEEQILGELLKRQSVLNQLDLSVSAPASDWKKEYGLHYTIYGSYAVIRKWLASAENIPPREIAALILDLTQKTD